MKRTALIWITMIAALIVLPPSFSGPGKDPGKGSIRVTDLRAGGRRNPLGIDETRPRLSWIIESEVRGDKQAAYRILVASSRELLDRDTGDLWDTKKVRSDQSVSVYYDGEGLASGSRAFWKVKVWNAKGRESEWSEPGMWSMGLLDPGDWRAEWIGLDKALGNDRPDQESRELSARYLRKEFDIEKPVARAMAYIVGLGVYEMYLNGERVGDHVLSPGLTEYPKRSFYITYDVTGMLKKGVNTAGVILGSGRYFAPRILDPTPTLTYGFPKMLLQIEVEFNDGSDKTIVSDASWKITADGPILVNNEYDGELYDARKEMPGWNKNGYDDSDWMPVERVEKPSETISAQMNEPIRIMETIKPVALSEPRPGVYVFDMGQNMVGWTKLSVEGEAGTEVRLRFAETLKEDGMLYTDNLRGAKCTDTYILRGGGDESYEPRFVFHGFRFVEMTGYPGTPNLSVLEGKVLHDDLEPVGSFECSNDLINNIYRNAVWGLRGNYRSVPTDCPQRDERQGWLGDRAEGSRGESYIFDISKLYRKWLVDIFDAQKESGSISDVNPAYWPFFNDNVTWAGAPVQLVKMLYDHYGDRDVIVQSYTPLKKWIDYMVSTYMENGLMPRDNYGDWCVPPVDPEVIHTRDPARLTAGEYLGTSYFYYYLTLMEEFALMLGKSEDAGRFGELAATMKEAFNSYFFDRKKMKYSNNTATASILALAFDLVPEEYERVVFENLVKKIEVEHDAHITTGLVGQQFFNRVLTRYGRADLAMTVNTQPDYPGYGYMMENGATTIWELWNGNTADPAMNSHNHVMLLGDFLTWLYEDLAGISPDESDPGFRHIVMKPTLIEGLDRVEASHKCSYGMIRSAWETEGGVFDWTISVPVNTTATVYIPVSDVPEITEGGNPYDLSGGEISGGICKIELSSGDYHFRSSIQYALLTKRGEYKICRSAGIKGPCTAPYQSHRNQVFFWLASGRSSLYLRAEASMVTGPSNPEGSSGISSMDLPR